MRRAGAADGHDHPLRAGGERRHEGLGQRRGRQRRAVVSPSSSHVYTSKVTGSPAGQPRAAPGERARGGRQLGRRGGGGEHVHRTAAGAGHRRGHDVAPVDGERAHVAGIAAAVVAAGHRLEHDRTGGRRVDRQAAQQQRRERLRAVDERGHVGVALRARSGRPRGRRGAPPSPRTWRRGRRAAAVRRRCRSGPRGPGRRRPGGGAGWPRPGASRVRRRASSIASPCGPCSSQRSRMSTTTGIWALDALLRLVDPVQRLLERRRPLEVVDAVVAERPAQGGQERRRQPLPLDVERAEVGVEVLLRGAHLHVGVGLVARAPEQHPQVGEGDEHVLLGGGEVGVGAEGAPRRGQVGGRRRGRPPPRCRSRAPGRAAARGRAGTAPWRRRRRARARSPARARRAAGCSASGSGPVGSSCTRAAPVSTCSFGPASRHRTRPANGAGTAVSIFMLSMTATGIAGSHLVAGRDGQGDDHARRRGPHDALVVAAEPVRCAVDLDEMLVALHGRHDPRRSRSEVQPPLERPERLEADHRRRPVELDGVGVRAEAVDVQPVAVAAVSGARPCGPTSGAVRGRPRCADAKKRAWSTSRSVS